MCNLKPFDQQIRQSRTNLWIRVSGCESTNRTRKRLSQGSNFRLETTGWADRGHRGVTANGALGVGLWSIGTVASLLSMPFEDKIFEATVCTLISQSSRSFSGPDLDHSLGSALVALVECGACECGASRLVPPRPLTQRELPPRNRRAFRHSRGRT